MLERSQENVTCAAGDRKRFGGYSPHSLFGRSRLVV
jgi:hypothetical protein